MMPLIECRISETQKALGELRSMYSSSGAQTDRNSPQGPPAHSPAVHSSASMVGGDPPMMGAAQQQQQQQQYPHMQGARGPWEAAQHVQQQRRPNSHTLDRNSPQGPPAHSSAVHNSANKTNTAQQQRQRPRMDPLQDLPPGCSNQSSTPHHARTMKINRAAALAGQEEGIDGTALAQEQQRPSKRPSHRYRGGLKKQEQM